MFAAYTYTVGMLYCGRYVAEKETLRKKKTCARIGLTPVYGTYHQVEKSPTERTKHGIKGCIMSLKRVRAWAFMMVA